MVTSTHRSEDPDFDTLIPELIKHIRGHRSQQQLNKKLGFSHNQLTRWETGRRTLSWIDFVHICQACRVPLRQALIKALNVECQATDTQRLMANLMGDRTLIHTAQKLGTNRFAVSRWLTGTSIPSLKDVLSAIHYFKEVLFPFLEHLTDVHSLPGVHEPYELYKLRRNAMFDHPALIAIYSFIFLEEYQKLLEHEPGLIARQLGISEEEERAAFDILTRLDYIRWNGKKYEYGKPPAFIRTMSIDRNNELYRFWTDRAAAFLRSPNALEPGCKFAYLVGTVNDALYARIVETLTKTYEDIIRMISEDTAPCDKLKVINLQIMDILNVRPPAEKVSAQIP